MYVSTESKLHILRIKHFLICSFKIVMVILVIILNYKIGFTSKKVASLGIEPWSPACQAKLF